jgi:hypothetical protein
VFEKSALRRIFGPKRDQVLGNWIKLYNEELHNLYSSSNTIRMIKSRKKKWEVYVECMRRGMHRYMGLWWKRQKEGLDVGGRIILIWI